MREIYWKRGSSRNQVGVGPSVNAWWLFTLGALNSVCIPKERAIDKQKCPISRTSVLQCVYFSLKITSMNVYSVASDPAITRYFSTPLLLMLTSLKTLES